MKYNEMILTLVDLYKYQKEFKKKCKECINDKQLKSLEMAIRGLNVLDEIHNYIYILRPYLSEIAWKEIKSYYETLGN